MNATLARFIVGITLALVVVACSGPGGAVTSVVIDGGDQRTVLGSALTLTATVVTTGEASDAVSWSSSDETVATVDMAGNVTSLAVGASSITATSTADASKSDAITLTVDPLDGVSSVAIDGGDQSTVLGSALTLTATVATTGDASDAVSWSSSDETVATIDVAGNVSSLAVGATSITATSTADASKSDAVTLTANPGGVLDWTRQFGTSAMDAAIGVATDTTGNVYTTGITSGAIAGANAGGSDVFVRSYDGNGNVRWSRQFGTINDDDAVGIATGASGIVYITGSTAGDLEGANAGSSDGFLRSYDSDGNLRWTRQFGTGNFDEATSVATDVSGNVYVTGHTLGALEGSAGGFDVFLRSYDSDGNVRWTRQFGTSNDEYARGVATDASGNVYSAGYTSGALDGSNAGRFDALIRSYDSDGDLRWTRQFGTSGDDYAFGIAADASANVYISGTTAGALEGANAGGDDVFVRSFDGDGNLRWTRQFGSSTDDLGEGVATDGNGNVYASGYTLGTLEGVNAGSEDAFIRSFDSDGTLHWTRQFGTSGRDAALAIATDANANVYAAGGTYGDLDGVGAGDADAFVRKFTP